MHVKRYGSPVNDMCFVSLFCRTWSRHVYLAKTTTPFASIIRKFHACSGARKGTMVAQEVKAQFLSSSAMIEVLLARNIRRQHHTCRTSKYDSLSCDAVAQCAVFHYGVILISENPLPDSSLSSEFIVLTYWG